MTKNAIRISIKELQNIIKILKKEQKDLNKRLKLRHKLDLDRKFLVSISNSEGLSDTWFFD